MRLEDILKKQKDKGKEIPRLKASTLSVEDYTRDKNAPRPYNETFVQDDVLKKEGSDAPPILDFGVDREKVKFVAKNLPKVKEIIIKEKVVTRIKNDELNYEDLSGNAKLIVDEVVRRCLVLGDLTTSYIEKKELCRKLGIKPGSLKTTCVRLKEKKVLDDFEATKGRGSKWKFFISSRIFDEFKSSSLF